MNTLKLILFSVLISSLTLTASANEPPTKTKETEATNVETLRKELKEMVDNISFYMAIDVNKIEVDITFSIDSNNKIRAVIARSDNASVNHFIKKSLEGKQVNFENIETNARYATKIIYKFR